MALADALNNAHAPSRKLLIQEIYNRLAPDDQEALLDALNDPYVSQRALSAALLAEGHRISPTAIGDARRNGWEPEA